MPNGRSLALNKLKAHIENIALHHTIFDLPFAFMAAFLAAGGLPCWHTLLWIALAITGGRAAALSIDNLADLRFDRQQRRMAKRAMVSGVLSAHEVGASVMVYLGVCIYAVAQLPAICLKLLPIAAVPFVIYPFTKRFTSFCHMFLGLAIAMAPAGGWVAVRGTIDVPMLVLCTAVGLWISAFDIIYGAQDEKFDRSHGLHSMVTGYTAPTAFRIAAWMHVFCILLFFHLGQLMQLGWPYYIGIAIAAVTLFYQHHIVKPDDVSRVTQVYFMRNGLVSVALFLSTWIGLYIR
jgi:4-hydroxybenzoate polyprenyltransferase